MLSTRPKHPRFSPRLLLWIMITSSRSLCKTRICQVHIHFGKKKGMDDLFVGSNMDLLSAHSQLLIFLRSKQKIDDFHQFFLFLWIIITSTGAAVVSLLCKTCICQVHVQAANFSIENFKNIYHVVCILCEINSLIEFKSST